MKPVIGLMLGDVTGIGPEISARLLASWSIIQATIPMGESPIP